MENCQLGPAIMTNERRVLRVLTNERRVLPAGPGYNDGAPRKLARVTTGTFGDCKSTFCTGCQEK